MSTDRTRGERDTIVIVDATGFVIGEGPLQIQHIHTNTFGDTFITEEGYAGLEHRKIDDFGPAAKCADDCQAEIEMIVQIDEEVDR